MATYSTQGKDVLLDGKVVASGVDADAAIRMAQKSAQKAGGVFSPTPVNAPQQPTTTPTTPLATTTPATTPPSPQPSTKQYYAVGQDLYEAGTNRYIGATEWGRDWTGRATKVEAPTSQSIPTPTTPSEIEDTQAPVYTTGTTRAEEGATQAQAQQFTSQMQTQFGGQYGIPPVDQSIYTPFAQTQAGAEEQYALKMAEQTLKDVRAGNYTPEQRAQIESAIQSTASAYEPLIREAEQAKQQGLPRAEVLAGQLGGFLNTQFAGLAALIPVEGGNFRGAGGELERIASHYDQNIANAKSAAQRAIEEAKSRAIAAITTGAREDYELATIAYDRAKSAHDESIALSRQKTEDLINWAVKSQELQKYRQETASKTLDTMASAGYEREDIPDWYFEELDKSSGYMPGTSEAMFSVIKEEQNVKSYEQELKQAETLMGLLEKVPIGESVTINGVEYESLNKGELQVFKEDNGTDTQIIRFNKDTGEYSVTTLYGVTSGDGWEIVEKNGVTVYANPKTQEERFLFDNNRPNGGVADPTTLKQVFPDGYKPTNADLAEMGTVQLNAGVGGIQCGQFVRYITGYDGPSISSKEAKAALIDRSIGTDGNPPQAGDVFIQTAGTYDHIGVVLGANELSDGSFELQIVDANAKNDGTIRYRTINSKSVKGFGRLGMKEEFQFGTDGGDVPTDAERFQQPEKTKEQLEEEKKAIARANLPAGSYVDSSGNQAQLTAGQVEALSGFSGTITTANEILNIMEENDEPGVLGVVGDVGANISSLIGARSETRIKWNAKLELLRSEFQKAISGATVSDAEVKRLSKFLPKKGDTEKQVRQKMETLSAEFSKKRDLYENTLGVYRLILVRDKASGLVGTIPSNEFNANLYEKL